MPTLAETPAAQKPRALPRLILMTDEKRLPDPFPALSRLGPEDAVILRHYLSPERQELARDLLSDCRQRGLRLLIGADARLARQIGADGLHLPESMLRSKRATWRLWQRPGWLLTAAAHSPAALARAARSGVDAALLTPVFATASHTNAKPIGVTRFAIWTRAAGVPVYALGGITKDSFPRLIQAGAVGRAGISGLIT